MRLSKQKSPRKSTSRMSGSTTFWKFTCPERKSSEKYKSKRGISMSSRRIFRRFAIDVSIW